MISTDGSRALSRGRRYSRPAPVCSRFAVSCALALQSSAETCVYFCRMKKARIISCILLLAFTFGLSACKDKSSSSSSDDPATTPTYTASQSEGTEAPTTERIPLRILYVGLADTERSRDFITFLSRQFAEVKCADLYAFKEEQAQGSDVVILDKDGIQWGSDGGRPLYELKLSNAYKRPTVSIGIPGAFLADEMHLKTGYM